MTTTATATRLHTIGSVCRRLQSDFPDISISKIRYLEDQGLLSPKRTRGGYRLFSEEDVERLETILRLQRDEFLPLRVIRQELAAPASAERRRRRTGLAADEPRISVEELCEQAGISLAAGARADRLRPARGAADRGRRRRRPPSAPGSSPPGPTARHLRKFATAAGNQADLLEALVPKLRSRNPEARQGAARGSARARRARPGPEPAPLLAGAAARVRETAGR